MAMPNYLTVTDIDLPPLDAASLAELQALAAEAMGWQSLGAGAYLHHCGASAHDGDESVIQVVGVPDAGMVGMNVLLLV
jgi:hypothetical protein